MSSSREQRTRASTATHGPHISSSGPRAAQSTSWRHISTTCPGGATSSLEMDKRTKILIYAASAPMVLSIWQLLLDLGKEKGVNLEMVPTSAMPSCSIFEQLVLRDLSLGLHQFDDLLTDEEKALRKKVRGIMERKSRPL